MRKQWAILYIYFFKHEKIKMIRETKKYLSHGIVYSLQNCQNIIEIGVWDLSWAKYMPFFYIWRPACLVVMETMWQKIKNKNRLLVWDIFTI